VEVHAADATSPAETWYPFLEKGKWGFIDATGAWKIPPKFDACYDLFDKDIVRAWSKEKWGYIDRQGAWITKPQFNDPEMDFDKTGHEIVCIGHKNGILDKQGHIILPPKFDNIVLCSDRAWVRQGDKLGVFGYDGRWINEMRTLWPQSYDLPMQLNEDGIAWFQKNLDDGPWGVIDAVGRVVFPPQFDAHIMGRHESDPWDHPEGSDFEKGQAIVYRSGKSSYITAAGKILPHQLADYVSKKAWSPSLTLFDTMKDEELRDQNGKVIFAAMSIGALHEDRALFVISNNPPDMGFIDGQGNIVIPSGTYTLQDFSEGLAAAYRSEGTPAVSDNRRAGFLDRDGHEVIPFNYWNTYSFSGGYAAVTTLPKNEKGESVTPMNGYIDTTGKMVVSPSYDRGFFCTTPFCRGHAWVLKPGDELTGLDGISVHYAMIDASGNVLTDFRFQPPEYNSRFDNPQKPLETLRWVGDLAVLASGMNLGLATADGKILFEPQFRSIGPIHDDMIRVNSMDASGNRVGYLNAKGIMAIPSVYSNGTNFEKGVAWVTKAGPGTASSNCTLIDHQGNPLLEGSFMDPNFIRRPVSDSDTSWIQHVNEGGIPNVVGALICVANADGFIAYGSHERLNRMNWGYVDFSGHVIAWHKSELK
jgi:hypothetical protein